MAALLLKKGASINAQTADGKTPLHLSAYQGNREIVTLLLKHGGNKRAKTQSGERPIDLARQQGHTTLLPLLKP
jgi:ankyrin repeat protein